MTKTILIVGGTGAQGSAIVRYLAATGLYEIRCITRDTSSTQAQEIATLLHVSLFAGGYDEVSLAKALEGVEYVWVNTNGFALGESAETYWGIRIFQLSVRAGVKHFIYSGLDSAYRKSGYDPKLRVGHFEGKARVEEYMSAQPTSPMAWTCIDSGPYIESLSEMLSPKPDDANGTSYTFYIPMGSGYMPFIYLEDLARYVHWAYENPSESNSLRFGTSTVHAGGREMASAFTAVTGKPAKYQDIPIETWLDVAFAKLPNGPDTKVGFRTAHDSALTFTYRENFTNWFNLYKATGDNEGLLVKDYALLDRILPDRVRSLEEWMRKDGYKAGEGKSLLKDKAEGHHG